MCGFGNPVMDRAPIVDVLLGATRYYYTYNSTVKLLRLLVYVDFYSFSESDVTVIINISVTSVSFGARVCRNGTVQHTLTASKTRVPRRTLLIDVTERGDVTGRADLRADVSRDARETRACDAQRRVTAYCYITLRAVTGEEGTQLYHQNFMQAPCLTSAHI
jgi:hypothetical protein